MAIENDWHWLSREGATIFFLRSELFQAGMNVCHTEDVLCYNPPPNFYICVTSRK